MKDAQSVKRTKKNSFLREREGEQSSVNEKCAKERKRENEFCTH